MRALGTQNNKIFLIIKGIHMGNIIQSIPEAKLLLASLRSVGYTEETAIADIVDN